MEPFSIKAVMLGLFVGAGFSYRGMKRKSLTASGALAAFTVGFLHVASGLRGFNLLVFYFIGTKATKYKHAIKVAKDSTAESGGDGGRGASQVLACSLLSSFLSVMHAFYCGGEQSIDFASSGDIQASQLTCAIIAHHATCLADTLASEMGILAKTSPILITQPWRSVPPGTNGVSKHVDFLSRLYSYFGVSLVESVAFEGPWSSHKHKQSFIIFFALPHFFYYTGCHTRRYDMECNRRSNYWSINSNL